MANEVIAPAGEPWMRGTHPDLHPVCRAVVHALEQAEEDAERWCTPLDEESLFARPAGLPSVAFHLRHTARSLDRLLTYADDRSLSPAQLGELSTEHARTSAAEVWEEFRRRLAEAKARVAATSPESFAQVRGIGRQRLPTTVAGLLIHCAEHTQRHVGQMVTTAKLARGAHAEST